jgi:hypothetical protein
LLIRFEVKDFSARRRLPSPGAGDPKPPHALAPALVPSQNGHQPLRRRHAPDVVLRWRAYNLTPMTTDELEGEAVLLSLEWGQGVERGQDLEESFRRKRRGGRR